MCSARSSRNSSQTGGTGARCPSALSPSPLTQTHQVRHGRRDRLPPLPGDEQPARRRAAPAAPMPPRLPALQAHPPAAADHAGPHLLRARRRQRLRPRLPHLRHLLRRRRHLLQEPRPGPLRRLLHRPPPPARPRGRPQGGRAAVRPRRPGSGGLL